jgi:hypothetical protein
MEIKMKNRLKTILLITVLFSGCMSPQPDRALENNIKSIVISDDSSMVNPMNPVTKHELTLKSDLTLTFDDKKINITKAQFNDVIKGIKFVDISKLKEIKHPPTVGSSYKSVEINTDKKSYRFVNDNGTDYPLVVGQLASKVYKLSTQKPQNSDDEWQRLKLLKEYEGVDFHLKDGVEYLELRIYTKGQREKEYAKEYRVAVSMQQTPLEFFDAKLIKEFKNVKPNLSQETNIKRTGFCLMSGCVSIVGNGVMIDSKKKIWSMNTTEDILEMIGDVDTPAEVKLVLWLDSKLMSDPKEYIYKYRKVSNGYKVQHEFDNSISNLGECGHFLYEMFVGKDGKISKKKLLEKSESKNGCLAVD